MVLFPSSLGALTSFVLVSLFINAIITILPISATSGLAEEFLEQDDDRDLQSRIDHLKEPRLMDLLRLQRTVSKLLDESKLRSEATAISRETKDNESSSPRKRVFCNNFTGCGGRFRGRRRQQPQQTSVGKRLVLKRPFCNSVGCYNGAKRFLYPTLPRMPARDISGVKRLFCNGFAGCQNMGKRAGDGSMDEQATAIDALDLGNDLVVDETAVKLKRFFNGGFDENMEDVLKNLRR